MEKNQQLVTLCHNRLIFNFQDFLTIDDDEHKYKSFEKTDKFNFISEFQKIYNEIDENPYDNDMEPVDTPEILKKLNITRNGVYEIICDDSSLKSKFFDYVIDQVKTNRAVFMFTNCLNLTNYPSKNIQIHTIHRYVELHVHLNVLYEHLKTKHTYNAIILINDFTSICYELDVLPTHFKITVELVAICRKLVDHTKAVILCGSLPRKSGNIQQLNIGGIMPSPWRNLPAKFVYLARNGSYVGGKVENTFENCSEIVDISELTNF